MRSTKIEKDGRIILELEGRLDTTTAPEFQVKLLEEISIEQALILDFEKLVYVSSAGLRSLLAGQKEAKKTGKSITLCNVQDDIMEVFKMTGFSKILNFEQGDV